MDSCIEKDQGVKCVQRSIWPLLFVGLFETENNLKPVVRPMLGRQDKSDCGGCIDKVRRRSFDNWDDISSMWPVRR